MARVQQPNGQAFDRDPSDDARRILRGLECTRTGCTCHRSTSAGKGVTHCPVAGHHNGDSNPSLSIRLGTDQAIWTCHGPHTSEQVGERLREMGLWGSSPNGAKPAGSAVTKRAIATTDHQLRSIDGTLLALHHRVDYSDGSKSLTWRHPDGRSGLPEGISTSDLLYGLHNLVRNPTHVVIVEGEKAADRLQEALGQEIVVLATVGAEVLPSDQILEQLHGRTVALWPDNDDPGRRQADQLGRRLTALGATSIRQVTWPNAPPKGDAADFLEWEDGRAALKLLREATLWEPGEEPQKQEPYALELDEFVELKLESPVPLIGDQRQQLLPVGGFVLLIAKGGKGKTTFTIDAALHLASGIEWLGFAVPRPLNILFIENEGPREPFRQKLERKRAIWPHPRPGRIFVRTLNWGAFAIADQAEQERLRQFIEQAQIDLVIGDPLDSMGLKGVGSPEDTREFVNHLVALGMTRDVAFWLLHHATISREWADELDAASGAWGGKPDTMLRLTKEPGNRARLGYPKIRWDSHQRPASILAFDPETEIFTIVGTEESEDRDLLQEVRRLLDDGRLRTAREIAAPKKSGGIGSSEQAVKPLLENHPELFVGINGAAIGRSPQGNFWRLRTEGEEVR